MCGGCLERVWRINGSKVSGGYLEGNWKVSCNEGVWRVSGKCLKVFRGMVTRSFRGGEGDGGCLAALWNLSGGTFRHF